MSFRLASLAATALCLRPTMHEGGLAAVVKDIATVPEPLRPYYEQKGDRYELKAEGIDDHSAVLGLKKNREEFANDKFKLAEKLKAFEGVDIERYNKLTAAEQDAEQKRLAAEGNFKALEQQLVEKFNTERTGLTGKLTKREQQIDELVRKNNAIVAITALGGEPELLLPLVLAQTQAVEDEATGAWRAVVIDPATKQARISNAQGAPMTLADLVTEMKSQDKYAGAFTGTGASGSGATGSNNPAAGAAGAVKSRADLKTDAEKAAFIDTKGLAAFKALPA